MEHVRLNFAIFIIVCLTFLAIALWTHERTKEKEIELLQIHSRELRRPITIDSAKAMDEDEGEDRATSAPTPTTQPTPGRAD